MIVERLWECLIGVGLLVGRGLRVFLLLLYVQMLGTLTPIVLLPREVFARFPWAPSLERPRGSWWAPPSAGAR